MDAGEIKQKTEKEQVFYSCGCSLIALDPDFDVKIEALCLKCGNLFTIFDENEILPRLKDKLEGEKKEIQATEELPEQIKSNKTAEENKKTAANEKNTISELPDVPEKPAEISEPCLAELSLSGEAPFSAEPLKDVQVEPVEKVQAEEEEIILPENCLYCTRTGWMKVYIQEWDRIRCHNAPCPVCHKQEWLKWSADKWLVDEIDLK